MSTWQVTLMVVLSIGVGYIIGRAQAGKIIDSLLSRNQRLHTRANISEQGAAEANQMLMDSRRQAAMMKDSLDELQARERERARVAKTPRPRRRAPQRTRGLDLAKSPERRLGPIIPKQDRQETP